MGRRGRRYRSTYAAPHLAPYQNPDHISEIIYADCDYTLDLNKMTSTFFSRSLGNIGSTIPYLNNISLNLREKFKQFI